MLHSQCCSIPQVYYVFSSYLSSYTKSKNSVSCKRAAVSTNNFCVASNDGEGEDANNQAIL